MACSSVLIVSITRCWRTPWWWFLVTLVFPYSVLVLSQLFIKSLYDLDAAIAGLGVAQLML